MALGFAVNVTISFIVPHDPKDVIHVLTRTFYPCQANLEGLKSLIFFIP